VGGLDDEAELGRLLVVGQRVALDGGSEPALAGQAQLVQRHEPGRLVHPALEVILRLQLRPLGGDQAEDDQLARGHEPQRREAAGALVVVLQEEPVHVQPGKQRLGHEIVPAGGDPAGPEVAPAQVRGDRHPGRAVLDGGVDLGDVAQVQAGGVLAPAGDPGALGRVVEVGQGGVVELQVGAAQRAQPGDLVGVGGGQVGPERLHLRVDGRVEHGRAAAVVHHVRRRDRQLRHRGGDVRLQEGERVGEDRLVDPDLAVDMNGRRGELDIPGGVVELDGQVARRLGHPAEGVDEVHVPRGAAELPVGGGLQPDLLLHPDHARDLLVLRRPQLGR